jgi:hypothetical protein
VADRDASLLITKPSPISARATARPSSAQFVALCRQMGLLAKASVAIDGSKFKAVNSPARLFFGALNAKIVFRPGSTLPPPLTRVV